MDSRKKNQESSQGEGMPPLHQESTGETGMGIVWLSIAMVVIGTLVSVAMSVAPNKVASTQANNNMNFLEAAQQAVQGFLLANKRLPCPDTDNDGAENGGGGANCTSNRGTIPFRTIGLGSNLDAFQRPIAYAVYNNVGGNAALALNSISTSTNVTAASVLCTRLKNAIALGTNATFAYVSTLDSDGTQNRPFVVASQGAVLEGAVAVGWEGNNTAAGIQFDDPTRSIVPRVYNDQVLAPTFSMLMGRLGCNKLSGQQSPMRFTVETLPIIPAGNQTVALTLGLDGGTPNNGTWQYKTCWTGSTLLSTYSGLSVSPTPYSGSTCLADSESFWTNVTNGVFALNITGTVTCNTTQQIGNFTLFARDNNDPTGDNNSTSDGDTIISKTYTVAHAGGNSTSYNCQSCSTANATTCSSTDVANCCSPTTCSTNCKNNCNNCSTLERASCPACSNTCSTCNDTNPNGCTKQQDAQTCLTQSLWCPASYTSLWCNSSSGTPYCSTLQNWLGCGCKKNNGTQGSC